MEEILSRIQEKKNRLKRYQPFPASLTKNFLEWFKIELTYTSNAIEGNTLSRKETALIVEKGITVEGKSVKEHLEAINHAKAFEFIQTLSQKNLKDISEKTILAIHALILQNIDNSNAGRYRTVPVRIAGSNVILPNAVKVPFLMQDLINWLHSAKGEVVEIAALAHFKLVSIHPLTDGNGRTARLLMNLILMQDDYPCAIIRKEDRVSYINSTEKGQLNGDLLDYYQIVYSAIERSLDIYLSAMEPKETVSFAPNKLLKIGEVAKLADETVPTIRFWTKEGLLKVEKLTKGGYQLYLPSVLGKIKKIRQLQRDKRLTIRELKRALI